MSTLHIALIIGIPMLAFTAAFLGVDHLMGRAES